MVTMALEAMWEIDGFKDELEKELTHFGAGYLHLVFAWLAREKLPPADRVAVVRRALVEKRDAFLAGLYQEPKAKFPMAIIKKFCELSRLTNKNWIGYYLACMDNPAIRTLLSKMRVIDPRVFENLRHIPDWACLPTLIPALVTEEDWIILDHVDYDFEMLPYEDIQCALESLKRVRDPKGFGDWSSKLSRQIIERHYPDPPFKGTEYFRAIDTYDALLRESREMRNCLSTRGMEVVRGEEYYYSWRGLERATVGLYYKHECNEWIISDIAGLDNEEVSDATMIAIDLAFRRMKLWKAACQTSSTGECVDRLQARGHQK